MWLPDCWWHSVDGICVSYSSTVVNKIVKKVAGLSLKNMIEWPVKEHVEETGEKKRINSDRDWRRRWLETTRVIIIWQKESNQRNTKTHVKRRSFGWKRKTATVRRMTFPTESIRKSRGRKNDDYLSLGLKTSWPSSASFGSALLSLQI